MIKFTLLEKISNESLVGFGELISPSFFSPALEPVLKPTWSHQDILPTGQAEEGEADPPYSPVQKILFSVYLLFENPSKKAKKENLKQVFIQKPIQTSFLFVIHFGRKAKKNVFPLSGIARKNPEKYTISGILFYSKFWAGEILKSILFW